MLITRFTRFIKREITEPLTCHCVQCTFKYGKKKKVSDLTTSFLKMSDVYFPRSNIPEKEVHLRVKN